jgi:hypothetical protein
LAALPRELRRELEHAVISLDGERIMLLASRISERNPSVGRALADLAGISAYTPILQALSPWKTVSAKATL